MNCKQSTFLKYPSKSTAILQSKLIQENLEYLDIFWCCLPITLPCTVSSYAVDWQCWGVHDENLWVRPMPENEYIVNINNHKFDFFRDSRPAGFGPILPYH